MDKHKKNTAARCRSPPRFGFALTRQKTKKRQGENAMFNQKSIYALNKLDREAIVYTDAEGNIIRLAISDFTSEEEFRKWKDWSDNDYLTTEKKGRGFDDRCISLELLSEDAVAVESVEETVIEKVSAAAHETTLKRLRQESEETLTEAQYLRLWHHAIDGLSEAEIAALEGVSQQNISKSILTAKKQMKKFFKNRV